MVLIFSFLACLKTADVSGLATNTTIPSIALIEMDNTIIDFPSALEKILSEELSQKNIQLQFRAYQSQKKQDSSEILRSLHAEPALVIEAKAEFSSQLNGRFRWETFYHISLATNGSIKEKEITIPVFLLYHHQREADALLASETILRRELELFLQTQLGK